MRNADRRPQALAISRPVWFFLVEVKVTGHMKQPWTAGSKALVQCFVPGQQLEQSLILLDAKLETEELERIDTIRAIRYEPNEGDPEVPGDHFREPLERAASMNEPILGVFVVSDDTANSETGAV